jgi:hypothetical protein
MRSMRISVIARSDGGSHLYGAGDDATEGPIAR